METGAAHRGRSICTSIFFRWLAVLTFFTSLFGCSGIVGVSPLQSPPSSVSLTVTPSTALVLLGQTQSFTASVSNGASNAVNWSVNGIPGGTPLVGTISANGTYTSPSDLPATTSVTIQATSAADASKVATAVVNIASDVSLSISPQATPVELGAVHIFSASISSAGNPDRAVRWLASGPGCVGVACGNVSPNGAYTAPQVLISPPSVTVTAVSVADSSKIAVAAVTITSSFSLLITGPGSVNTGTAATYAANMAPAANSNPASAVVWSVSGAGCALSACGTISAGGQYTAPPAAPFPATIQVTATPLADISKAVTVSVAILSVFGIAISPSTATAPLGGTQLFGALVTGSQDATVTWDVNGIVGGNVALGTVQNSRSVPATTIYTAPLAIPAGGSVTVTARSNASPGLFARAQVSVNSSIGVILAPLAATRAVGHWQMLQAQVTGATNQNVTWQVAGIPNGNAAVGQICMTASNPCQPVASASTGSVYYLAPGGVPSPNVVPVAAISQADPTKSATALVTILPHVIVSVSPGAATLASSGQQRFVASLAGTDSQQVTWQIAGAACGLPGACGLIDAAGLYVAPPAVPTPDLITVVGTSVEDSSQSASATVVVSAGTGSNPSISGMSPSSANAGSAGGFTVRVGGSNFLASTPGPGSIIQVAGIARNTFCSASTNCTTTLNAADLSMPGALSVRAQNPDGTISNTVTFTVLAAGSVPDVISLTPGAPSVSGKNIVVAELSTNGGSGAVSNSSLNVGALGAYVTATTTCTLGGSTVVVFRPASGVATADLCVFSVSGLDPSFAYSVTGSTPADITVIGREPLGLGIIHLTLQVPSTAALGPRTLFIENPSKDLAAGTGTVEVR